MNYELPDVCKQCGGECCKHYPGNVSPSDLGSTADEILEEAYLAVLSGRYRLDVWDGPFNHANKFVYDPLFLRPAMKEEEGDTRPLRRGWWGECTFLTEAGCELEHHKRPHACRSLEPNPRRGEDGQHCTAHNDGKEQYIAEWMQYDLDGVHSRLLEAVDNQSADKGGE